MKSIKFLLTTLLTASFFILTSAKTADGVKERKRIENAANIIEDFGKMKESIPHKMIVDCEGIIIIPKMLNAGFVVGAKRGRGIAMVKLENGKWSNPVFITLTGGSIGFQIGVQSVDLVLVFQHKGVLTKVQNGDFTIGGDISAAAGPVGRSSTASTDYKMEAEVYSYSRSRGLFAGISITGASLSIDKTAIANFYGDNFTSQQLFESSKTSSDAIKNVKEHLNKL
jgi:lipid-binding SYLF domain-containing protein